MDALDWGVCWISAVLALSASGWFANTGRAARTTGTALAWARYASDVAIIATVIVFVLAIATDGRGCARSTTCFCENNDSVCIDQYCR